MVENVENSLTEFLLLFTTEFSSQLYKSTPPNHESLLLGYFCFIKKETDTKGKGRKTFAIAFIAHCNM